MTLLRPAFALTLALAAGTASAQAIPQDADKRAIEAVIETFRMAIIAKDGAALERLPVHPGISFMSAYDAQTIARIRKLRPADQRLLPDSYPAFVKFVGTSKRPIEETFSNVSIRADGTVATVYFNYQFKEDGRVTNSGDETWGLIATDAGWKISSIIWSTNIPADQIS